MTYDDFIKLHQTTVESFEQVTEYSAGGTFTGKLKTLYEGMVTFVQGHLNNLFKEDVDIPDLSKLLMIAEQYSTSEMRDKQVLQVPRLQKSWLEFAMALSKLQNVTYDIDQRLIKPMHAYIGKGINNPTLFASHSFTPDGYRFVDTHPYKTELGKYLSGKNDEFAPWTAAFPRQKDIVEFERVLQTLVMNDRKLKPETVTKAVNDLNNTVNILMSEIYEASTHFVLVKRSAMFISEMVLQVAEHVELYAITHNYVNDLLMCALKTQESLSLKQQ